MVKIRLARHGSKKRPFYRIVVANSESPRDGRFIEQIGLYDPTRSPVFVKIDLERMSAWRAKGAQPSQTVLQLIEQATVAASQPTRLENDQTPDETDVSPTAPAV
jgi:small subunit ribosomal protein S16